MMLIPALASSRVSGQMLGRYHFLMAAIIGLILLDDAYWHQRAGHFFDFGPAADLIAIFQQPRKPPRTECEQLLHGATAASAADR